MKRKSRVMGSIVGGAVGDALGYPVEFMRYDEIIAKFGKMGITQYPFSVGYISDDTQMTLFTIEGLLKENNAKSFSEELDIYKRNIYDSYLDWYLTQKVPFSQRKSFENYNNDSLLLNIEDMFDLRAPGNTCMSALKSGCMGSIKQPLNKSKGCGGVMRVAPIGLYFKPSIYDFIFIGSLAGEVSAITHGHLLGNMPSSMLAIMLYKICNEEKSLYDIITDSLNIVEKLYGHSYEYYKLKKIIKKAITLSKSKNNDVENIEEIGGGWVAEETLAIAIYCALKYEKDFVKAIIASVNHSGDSDSTGAVTGNIMGCLLGVESIPDKYIENLEMKDLIFEMAEKLV